VRAAARRDEAQLAVDIGRAVVERRAQAFFAELLPFYRLVGVAD